MSTHDQLCQPMQLGNLTLPNRVVMTTIKLGYGEQKRGSQPTAYRLLSAPR